MLGIVAVAWAKRSVSGERNTPRAHYAYRATKLGFVTVGGLRSYCDPVSSTWPGCARGRIPSKQSAACLPYEETAGLRIAEECNVAPEHFWWSDSESRSWLKNSRSTLLKDKSSN